MALARKRRPPLWGNFVAVADTDVLALACLWQNRLYLPAFYHGTQAIEKYLKALALSIIDPDGVREAPSTNPWLFKHPLCPLADRCKARYPYYGEVSVQTNLRRFTEFDQAARYPWVEQKHGNGFATDDLPIFIEMIARLRSDIPIQLDDYYLGMLVRGHHQGHPEARVNAAEEGRRTLALNALKQLWPDVRQLVRW